MAFLVIIPHLPPIAPEHFTPIDPCRWVVAINNPSSISDICVSLTESLADSSLGGISFGYPSLNADVEFLGVLSNLRPSDIFSTGWPWNPVSSSQSVVHLYLSIEPADILLEKMATKPSVDIRTEIARKTALNLFRFVESFQQSGSQALLRSPSDVLDQWFKRFEQKYKIDKNFILKSE